MLLLASVFESLIKTEVFNLPDFLTLRCTCKEGR